MKRSPDKIIKLFHDKLHTDRINKTHYYENEIQAHYLEILEIIVKDYPTYRRYFPKILDSLEQNNAVACSLHIFFSYYNDLLSQDEIHKLDLSILNERITKHTLKKFTQAFEEFLTSNTGCRISEVDFKLESFTKHEVREVVSFLITILQDDSHIIEWTAKECKNHILELSILRTLLESLGMSEYFYFVVSMFLNRLNSAEYFQAARDVAEEIIIASFKDDKPELGFLNSYQCYSRQGSIHAAILYANMSLHYMCCLRKPLIDKYIKEIIWESVKYFRDVGIYAYAIKIYESIPRSLQFSDYDKRAIDNSYFLCRLKAKHDEKLPNEVLYYLNKERESILCGGSKEAAPWLLILYNIRRIYSNADFSSIGLGFYLNVFESIVPKEFIEKYKNIINGNSIYNKNYLKISLIKLNETRSKADIVYDNNHALTIANRMIEHSFSVQDVEAILLAMMLKSDFSLIFQSKETSIFKPFELPDDDIQSLNSLYANEELPQKLSSSEHELIAWLAVTEGKVFQLSLIDGRFDFSILESFKWEVFHDLKKSYYFAGLSFNDEKKDIFGIDKVSPEEHLLQADEIKRKIDFCRLSSGKDSRTVLIVKDMELATFPHNLMLDEFGSFIHSTKPIANILSTEWYLSCKDENVINNDFTKSIWIPTEAGDLTLNKLYDTLKNELDIHQFNVFNQINMLSPVCSELNIICSHGDRDIASNQVIHPGSGPLDNLDKIIGSGKILIFFVCHSGSYKNEYFRNNITSIVKTYISLGYKAVIAPFWSLHVNIPQIWLNAFICSLNKGLSINYSVFMANKAIFKEYQTPAAWACMHLYGNPHLSIRHK